MVARPGGRAGGGGSARAPGAGPRPERSPRWPVASTASRSPTSERDARRQADRDRIEQAARALLTTDGWQRWIRVRASNGLSSYSLRNQMLIAIECHARGITPTYVAGFRAFLDLNRCVRKGERAIRILAPVAVKQRDEHGEETGEKRVFFRTVPVFDVCDDRPAARQASPFRSPPPAEPIDGDSHHHLIAPLIAHAASSATRVEIRELPEHGPGGWCDPKRRQIVVADGPANQQVRTLVHELAHAHGLGYEPVRPRAGRGARRLRHLLRAAAPSDSTSAASRSPTSPAGAKTAPSTRSANTPQTIDTIARRIEDALDPTPEPAADAVEPEAAGGVGAQGRSGAALPR